MPIKNILSRPTTSASTRKRFSTFERPSSEHSSDNAAQPNKSPERGHRKIGSLQRLSLSFTPSSQDATFQPFLTHEPDPMSRKNSLAVTNGESASRPGTSADTDNAAERAPSSSLPVLKSTTEEDEPATEEVTPKPQRFSLMRFKHPSEPQLSTRYKESDLAKNDPLPPPQIITTAPTQHHSEPAPKKSKDRFLPRTFSTFRKSMVVREENAVKDTALLAASQNDGAGSSAPNLVRALSENSPWQPKPDAAEPPAYGDETNSALALPVARMSESGGSEGSSGSHKLYAQTTTTRVIETTTTIFKLKRKKHKKTKDKGPLFPLPEKFPQPSSRRTSLSQANDEGSTIGRKSISPSRKSTHGIRWKNELSTRETPQESPSSSALALTNAPAGSPGPAIARKYSTLSVQSGSNTPTGNLIPPRLGARGRSSTMGSLGRSSERVSEVTPSTRNSTSTTGRRSFGDILTQRLRKESAPPRHGSGSGSTPGSKSNSFQLNRESESDLIYPEREEEDTPASYLEKLEAAVPRGSMATILCKGADEFSKTCLRKYMRGFSYFGESIDMSIRKMLMEVVLPKETQQIDRLLSGFADRYHECNPGIFLNADEANFVAFSILLLQSDTHNKNNKRKMTKPDYVKNTQNGKISVADDILECFFDNISYTPFIHFDDEIALNNHRLTAPKRKGGLRRTKSSEMLRGPVDPYTLILDNKLEALRPSLKEAIETEDTYHTAPINSNENHKAFVHAAVLQIVSARSRPDAFTNQATITNPAEAQVGLVSIKVAKVGLLWRKSAKKKKAKSPWQEWGVILTDSKLYFFKDVGWMRKLISQYEGYSKASSRGAPLVFKPPLSSFEPDAWMSMEDAVALTDSSYKRHKNAFTFIKHGGFEEVFLANTDVDVLDWISKLNYAATFRTAGVRMRGLLGTNYEGRNIYRKDSEMSNITDASLISDQPTPVPGKTNPQLAWEIMFYRRQLVSEKISSFDDHVALAQKELDYLLRNARHLLILLPIQQKSREAIVFAAGRMNAKLKWTRKEIWRARTHRDTLIKDLEAEATLAFPAPAQMSSKPSISATPLKTTPTKAGRSDLTRSDTDQTVGTNTAKSAATAPISATATRRPSQAVLEQITTSVSEPPELSHTRRKSGGSMLSASSKLGPRLGDDHTSEGRVRTPSVRTQASQHLSVAGESQAATDIDHDETSTPEVNLVVAESPAEKNRRRGSDSEKERKTNLSPSSDTPVKDRTGSVRKSLQRTLRETSNHVHVPHHTRNKKSKESGSSLAVTEDSRAASGDGEELKRDPTGRFVLHGKKASVITLSHDWQLSSEDRIKLREQMVREAALNEESNSKRASLHINTDMIDAKRRSVDQQSNHSEEVSPRAASNEVDDSINVRKRRSNADSTKWSVHSAVTTPAGVGETFHSAESSPRQSIDSTLAGHDNIGAVVGDGHEDESTVIEDDAAFTTPEETKEEASLENKK